MKGKLFEPIFPTTNDQKASKIWDFFFSEKEIKLQVRVSKPQPAA